MIDRLERAEEIYKNTIYSAQIEGEAKGEVKGEVKGRKEKALEIARNMLADGEPIGKIARYTELTEDEIRKLMH